MCERDSVPTILMTSPGVSEQLASDEPAPDQLLWLGLVYEKLAVWTARDGHRVASASLRSQNASMASLATTLVPGAYAPSEIGPGVRCVDSAS